MNLRTRKILDRAFSAAGIFAIFVMALALVVILAPIIYRGLGAYFFRATYDHRLVMFEQFEQGSAEKIEREQEKVAMARAPIFKILEQGEMHFRHALLEIVDEITVLADEEEGRLGSSLQRRLRRLPRDASLEQIVDTLNRVGEMLEQQPNREKHEELIAKIRRETSQVADINHKLSELKESLRHLLGPLPGDSRPELLRNQYGQTRWDQALEKLNLVLHRYEWDYSDPTRQGVKVKIPRIEDFRGTEIEPLFDYMENNIKATMNPRFIFYWRFLTNTSRDAHFFGGIWSAVLGTFYLTIGAMLFAIPMGVIAAIYLCEYAKPSRMISLLRSCISTLAGVPSIVFGLFGLAFFLNTIQVSDSKSVLAGSLTLALMVLPTVIRASEEAILAVPATYKEAALALGSGRWHTVITVVLPAALPGILTGIVISMGRAAGETAPIIFTAAVSVGRPLNLLETFNNPTPALPWNIYNLATEHEAVDEIRHVQFGMVFTLVALVLILNVTAIYLRAKVTKKLRG